jgi:hypothetical protein
MKQFFVFIYSQYSQASMNCDKVIQSLPPDVKFNYLCVDNPENRKIIVNDPNLNIDVVPCLLIVNAVDNRITKYDGKKCFDYLIQYKKQQTPIMEPLPMTTLQAPVPQPPPIQQAPPPPVAVQPPQPPPQPRPQKKIQIQSPPQNDFDDHDEGSFNNPPDMNQTSSISLLDDDDDDSPVPPPMPVSKKKNMLPPQQQQQQVPQSKSKSNSLLAQATAMQKSRLADDEFSTKKSNLN